MKLNDLRMAHKLWGTISAVVLCLGGAAAWSDYRIEGTVGATEAEVARYNELTHAATRWVGLTETNLQRSLAELVSAEPAIEATFGAARKKASAEITELQKRISDEATLDSDRAALEAVAAARAKVLALREEGFGLRKAGKAEALTTLIGASYIPATTAYVETLKRFVDLQAAHRDASVAQGLAERQDARLVSGAAALLVLAGVLGWVALLIRSICQPLARAVAVADAISNGDLTQRVDDERGDEFGQLLRAQGRMAQQLQGLVGEVRVGVHAVSVASSEIATGNHDLSERTERTASSLQETAASMEQLRSTVSQSVDTAQAADRLAASAAKAAERGGEVVGQVVASMQQISESSRRIADIIGVIDGIAFQTNILALNAAVEAARAGEQGRGFAVVASEVRSLASRSADAAKEIKALIGSSVARVESGSALVDETGRVMTEIVSSVKRVNSLMAEIASAAAEQRDGISQINQAVGGLDTMTQQNAALVEESAAAASSLKEQAQRLAVVVSVFDVGTADGAQRKRPAEAPIGRSPSGATEAALLEAEHVAA